MKTDPRETARRSERARMIAIIESREAVGRHELAVHVALHTDMTVREALALLRTAPRAFGPTIH
ncbi:hypothetical protein [Thiohalobacter thiocyanaticus]|uniref:hypothetical protein n=1 Tax=Thiohalobacter thiocyanaticus TaxID=585455 RepID=UPI000F630C94|nr:hypothetical protein [Thiohalobacter thiocyanaticus]